ncbi:MAG: hypothetical protein GY861_00770 [bacterium]|nr:hypothetical protein [bacterium]
MNIKARVIQNSQEKVTLKEIWLEVVNRQQFAGGKEEDAGSNEGDHGQSIDCPSQSPSIDEGRVSGCR